MTIATLARETARTIRTSATHEEITAAIETAIKRALESVLGEIAEHVTDADYIRGVIATTLAELSEDDNEASASRGANRPA